MSFSDLQSSTIDQFQPVEIRGDPAIAHLG